jgi:outer membrane protein TolC
VKNVIVARCWVRALAVIAATAAVSLAASRAQAEQEDLAALLKDYKVVTEDGRQTVELSLSQVLNLGLQRSTSLQSTRVGEEIAASAIAGAQDRNHPQLLNSASYGRTINAVPQFGGQRTDSTTLSSTLSKKLDSGVDVAAIVSETSVSGDTFGIDSAGNTSGFSGSKAFDFSALTAQVTIPIFQDFGDVNDVPVRLAEIGFRTSQNNTRQARLGLLRQVSTTYWDLVGVRESIKVAQDAVKLSDQLLKDNQARLQAGVLSPADVKVSESQLAQDRANLLDVQVQAQRIEDQVRAALNLDALPYGLKPVEEPKLRQGSFDLKTLLDKSLKYDPALANLESALARNGFEQQQADNLDKTNLDVGLKYTFNGYGGDFGGATGNLTQTDLSGYGATLTWTVPLFDTTSKETIRQKKLERMQIELQSASRRSEITVQAQAAKRLLSLAEENVKTARVAVSLQNELLQNEIERLRLGESTSFRVAQVQQDFNQARQTEILARIGYEKIFLDVLLLTGDIYSQYQLPPEQN